MTQRVAEKAVKDGVFEDIHKPVMPAKAGISRAKARLINSRPMACEIPAVMHRMQCMAPG
ncbi:MAG: hypothetical protein EPN97_17330 [Alphaproteobacteria bacterium]|nr:MAG: hypothetical protein EPN97_17330 [Alphaproteobacteria bacterium]